MIFIVLVEVGQGDHALLPEYGIVAMLGSFADGIYEETWDTRLAP